MALTGVEAVLFGVADLAEAEKYLADWGLSGGLAAPGLLEFHTRDGSAVRVRQLDDPLLPAPMEPGPTLREVTWGVDHAAHLVRIIDEFGEEASRAADGTVRVTDPNGLVHAFQVTRRSAVEVAEEVANAPGRPRRIDRRGTIHECAKPLSIGHVVLFVNELQSALDFFVNRLGFVVSDSYPGNAAFLRARTPGPHHDAFVLERPGKPGLNHVAFTVGSLHEVVGGGMDMMRRGWTTDLGPGRHPISSALFWYMRSPFGGSFEYYTDDDYCTDAWQPGEFERRPEMFAEWAIAGGIDGHSRRQFVAPQVQPDPRKEPSHV